MSSADSRFFERENLKFVEPFRNRIVGRKKFLAGSIFSYFYLIRIIVFFENFMCLACYGGL